MTRRSFVPALVGAALFAQENKPAQRKGKLKQGVTGGVFGKGMRFEDQCRHAARLGVQGFDLKGPADWPGMKKYGLIPSMAPGGGGTLPDALHATENHPRIEPLPRALLDQCGAAGAPQQLTLSA